MHKAGTNAEDRVNSSRRMESTPSAPSPPTTEMSQEEIDVIAEAINNL